MLQFDPLESSIEPSFWETLARVKMEIYRLDDSLKTIGGRMNAGKRLQTRTMGKSIGPPRLTVGSFSFESHHVIEGVMKNTNTLPDFKELDKNLFLRDCAERVF